MTLLAAMSTSELLLLSLFVIFAAPWLAWRFLRLEQVAPLAIVQIVGGILMGPGLLGALAPAAHAALFTPAVIQSLMGIASWGVMIFVFLAGLELDLARLWHSRRETGLVAACALAVPMGFGCMAAALLIQFSDGWLGPRAHAWQGITGLGMACAVTALPILVLLLEQLGIMRTAFGQRVLRYASLDDAAIWIILALVLLDWPRLERQALFLALALPAAILVRALLRRAAEGERWLAALIWLAALGFAADWAGLHFMVGAFMAGAALDTDMFGEAQSDMLRKAVLLTMMPVFFLSTGLRTSWVLGGAPVVMAALLFLAAAVAGKLAGVHLAGRFLNWPKGEARIIGWLLQTKALIMIIFSTILLDKGIITADAFTALLLMAVMSTVLTVPMVRGRLAAVLAR
ncbi:MAG: cation:proton antiporter [Hyphomicrobiales bacterium]